MKCAGSDTIPVRRQFDPVTLEAADGFCRVCGGVFRREQIRRQHIEGVWWEHRLPEHESLTSKEN